MADRGHFEKMAAKKLVGAISYEFIKNKMADRKHFEKMVAKKLVGAISYEPLVGRIQI